jgi:hypothetical protein
MTSALTNAQSTALTHKVTRVSEPVSIDADWNKPVWAKIKPIKLKNYMGEKPDHFPDVNAKLAYDEHNIYIIWQVKDRYVRAVAEKHQDAVYQDSCVEFFFIPDNLGGSEYFNLEMNCGGTMLFHHQEFGKEGHKSVSDADIEQMEVAHSLPKIISQEIKEKTTWYLEYAIPFKILAGYYQMEAPTSGTTWRANFYKCADKTSYPHWITWSKVQYPEPRFHLPEFFGTLVFE